jgi:hypothetical protein
MRKSICIYCQLPFDAPAPACPHCGGPIDARRQLPELGRAANEDRTLVIEDLDEEFEIVPVKDVVARFGQAKPSAPIPPFGKHVARA